MSTTQAYIIIGLLGLTIIFVASSINNESPDKRFARKVAACFDDVKWDKQVFWSSGTKQKDRYDRDIFYGCDTIDDAIKKLNKVLDDAGVEPKKAGESNE